jgi:hypothetical protein
MGTDPAVHIDGLGGDLLGSIRRQEDDDVGDIVPAGRAEGLAQSAP